MRSLLDEKLGLADGETLDEKLDKKLGLAEGETLDEKLGKLFGEKLGVTEGKAVDSPKMERQVKNLMQSNPDAVLRDMVPFVVGRGGSSEDDAILHGSQTTWTLFKKSLPNGESPTVLAASCAHCAFPYDLVGFRQTGLRFVAFPPELRNLVYSVGCLPEYLAGRQGRYC